MNTTQTSPANPVPALTPLAQSLLADWDDPDLSELDLARRHGLTLDQLAAHAAAPAFQHALALCRSIRASRRPLIITRAEAQAAQRLTAPIDGPGGPARRAGIPNAADQAASLHPTSATAAKEVRLAIKALLALLGAGGFQPPDRPQGDAALGAVGFQPTDRPQADARVTQPSPHPTSALRADGGQDAPRSKTARPKRPRGVKPRPKPVSR